MNNNKWKLEYENLNKNNNSTIIKLIKLQGVSVIM